MANIPVCTAAWHETGAARHAARQKGAPGLEPLFWFPYFLFQTSGLRRRPYLLNRDGGVRIQISPSGTDHFQSRRRRSYLHDL